MYPKDPPDGGKNRFYARHMHDQEILKYGLLQKTPYGHVPLYFQEEGGVLPSPFYRTSTNGMDLEVSASFSGLPGAATIEPYFLGNYCSFLEDRQPISVETRYEGKERGILASLILKESTENVGTFTNEYKLTLLDPVEGGVEIWGDERAAVANEVISVTISFNTEYVSDYVGEATPIVSGKSYLVEVPVFGYRVVDFTSKTK